MNKAVASLGMEVRFSNIFAKPGKPTIFWMIGNRGHHLFLIDYLGIRCDTYPLAGDVFTASGEPVRVILPCS